MADRDSDIWFREVRPGKWKPVNAKGYAAMLGPHIALMLFIFIPPLAISDPESANRWPLFALLLGLPCCLGVIFWLAKRHSRRSG